MSNKATQGQVPGLYGLWKQDIFFVDNLMLKRRMHFNFCCNWSIGSREKQVFVTEFFARKFWWFLSTTVDPHGTIQTLSFRKARGGGFQKHCRILDKGQHPSLLTRIYQLLIHNNAWFSVAVHQRCRTATTVYFLLQVVWQKAEIPNLASCSWRCTINQHNCISSLNLK